jgi:hypothetical protein
MKRISHLPLISLLLIWVASACDTDDTNDRPSRNVELYLINSFSTLEHSCQIDEKTVVTKMAPLLYYSDFLSYDTTEYTFEISDRARKAVLNLEHSVHGLPFAIKANGTLIYTGYFWPSYSSASCNWIVIDPFQASISNQLHVELGYPGLHQGQTVPDKRNDNRIVEIFQHDHKLK